MTHVQPKRSLIDHFSALKDPRQAGKILYSFEEAMLLVLCATLAGAEGFVEIEEWGNRKLDFLRQFALFERGIASHDALNDLFNALDADLFGQCFIAWVEDMRAAEADIVAIDGKTSRRAHARGGRPLHMVSAWATRQRLVLGQQATASAYRRPGHHRCHGLPDHHRRNHH
jgi:DDE_Tnp_1-associated